MGASEVIAGCGLRGAGWFAASEVGWREISELSGRARLRRVLHRKVSASGESYGGRSAIPGYECDPPVNNKLSNGFFDFNR